MITPVGLAAQKVKLSRLATVVIYDARRPADPPDVQVSEEDNSLVAFPLSVASGGSVVCAGIQRAPAPDAPPQPLNKLMALVQCAANPGTMDAHDALLHRIAAAEQIALVVRAHAKESSLRATSVKSDSVRVVVLQTATALFADAPNPATPPVLIIRGRRSSIKIAEDARQSQLSADIETLVRLGGAIATARLDTVRREDVRERQVTWASVNTHVLKLKRATLTLEVSVGGPADVVLATSLDPRKQMPWLKNMTRNART